jgi:hypothetical protein
MVPKLRHLRLRLGNLRHLMTHRVRVRHLRKSGLAVLAARRVDLDNMIDGLHRQELAPAAFVPLLTAALLAALALPAWLATARAGTVG